MCVRVRLVVTITQTLQLCRTQTTVTNAQNVLQNPNMISRSIKRAVLLLVAGSPFCIGSARAGLGGDAASALADASELHGIVNSVSLPQYDIQDITADTGMRVREYVSRDGVVFAVSWAGPVQPDLQRLLGTHYVEYTTALAALHHPGLQRSVRIASPELIVESGGHLRAYAGRALLPALVPAGVSAADLL
jgi:Protein of unknown function (DUF2844)